MQKRSYESKDQAPHKRDDHGELSIQTEKSRHGLDIQQMDSKCFKRFKNINILTSN